MDWIGAIARNFKEMWRNPWAAIRRKRVEVAFGIFLVVAAFFTFTFTGSPKMASLGGTGGKSAAFHRFLSPNGDAFFGKPSGRYCDGRVIIDFIAEKLKLPYLSAYLDSIGSKFRHGANFATGGSTIQALDTKIFESGFSPISLDKQILQFEQFKARTLELQNEDGGSSYIQSSLPRPEDFGKALYTLDIGQNDLHFGFSLMTEEQVLETIPNIVNQFAQAAEKLYLLGARVFWVHNTGPIGCLPYSVIRYPPKPDNVDQNGYVKSHNAVAKEFNRQLKEKIFEFRMRLPHAVITYVDIYSAKYSLISEAKKHGFVNPLGYCCGHSGVQYGKNAKVNGTLLFGSSCSNSSLYINWDGVHYSQAANIWVATQILNGSLSDPLVLVSELCDKQVRDYEPRLPPI